MSNEYFLIDLGASATHANWVLIEHELHVQIQKDIREKIFVEVDRSVNNRVAGIRLRDLESISNYVIGKFRKRKNCKPVAIS